MGRNSLEYRSCEISLTFHDKFNVKHYIDHVCYIGDSWRCSTVFDIDGAEISGCGKTIEEAIKLLADKYNECIEARKKYMDKRYG